MNGRDEEAKTDAKQKKTGEALYGCVETVSASTPSNPHDFAEIRKQDVCAVATTIWIRKILIPFELFGYQFVESEMWILHATSITSNSVRSAQNEYAWIRIHCNFNVSRCAIYYHLLTLSSSLVPLVLGAAVKHCLRVFFFSAPFPGQVHLLTSNREWYSIDLFQLAVWLPGLSGLVNGDS